MGVDSLGAARLPPADPDLLWHPAWLPVFVVDGGS